LNDEKIICQPQLKLIKMPGLVPGIFILIGSCGDEAPAQKGVSGYWI
jgi:hypothetical protein